MASITIISKERVITVIEPHKEKIRENLTAATAKTLNRQEKDVIVDFQKWGNPEPENAPDILIRAETSLFRRSLLKPWGHSLLQSWQTTIDSLEVKFNPKLRVAVKPYVLDSEWIEE